MEYIINGNKKHFTGHISLSDWEQMSPTEKEFALHLTMDGYVDFVHYCDEYGWDDWMNAYITNEAEGLSDKDTWAIEQVQMDAWATMPQYYNEKLHINTRTEDLSFFVALENTRTNGGFVAANYDKRGNVTDYRNVYDFCQIERLCNDEKTQTKCFEITPSSYEPILVALFVDSLRSARMSEEDIHNEMKNWETYNKYFKKSRIRKTWNELENDERWLFLWRGNVEFSFKDENGIDSIYRVESYLFDECIYFRKDSTGFHEIEDSKIF